MTSKTVTALYAEKQGGHLPAFIRQRELLDVLPFSAATLWRKVRDGSFVAPVKLGARITAWNRAEVLAWLEEIGGTV